jgi:hypothetical protein
MGAAMFQEKKDGENSSELVQTGTRLYNQTRRHQLMVQAKIAKEMHKTNASQTALTEVLGDSAEGTFKMTVQDFVNGLSRSEFKAALPVNIKQLKKEFLTHLMDRISLGILHDDLSADLDTLLPLLRSSPLPCR